MKTSTKLWVGFRMCRVAVFAFSTFLSMALSVIYAVLLIREWKSYNNAQRTIVIITLVVNALSTILLYLMIIVRFRLWLDGLRVAFVALFQGGSAITFAIFNSSFPCDNLGPVRTCKTVSTVAIFGGCTLTGLLILYAFCLAIMSHVPRPSPPRNPEESLVDGVKKLGHQPSSASVTSSTTSKSFISDSKNDKWNEKRRSLGSESGSEYSEISWIGSRATTPHLRSPSLASRSTTHTERYGVYRPSTPQSIRSPTASSISSSLYPAKSVSSNNTGYHQPGLHPSGYYSNPSSPFPPKPRLLSLPNPFLEPVSRSGTPGSMLSVRSDGFLYSPRTHTRNLISPPIPPSLLAGGGLPKDPPPYRGQHRGFLPGNIPEGPTSASPAPLLVPDRVLNSSTPFAVRPGIPTMNSREALRSPGAMTVISHSASIRVPPNRCASLISVPRSPSPYNPMGLPASPQALLLPNHPQFHPADLRSVQRFHEIRRYGSSPDFRQDGPLGGYRQLSPGSVQGSPNGQSRPLPDPRQMRQAPYAHEQR